MQSIFAKTSAALLLTLGLVSEPVSAVSMYNPLRSAVAIYNNKNFEKQVTNNREKGISIVQYYKAGDESSKRDQGQYEKFGLEHKQMLRVGSVDCVEFAAICDKQGVTEFPSYKVYPPHPVPVQNYSDVENTVDTDKLKKMAYKFIGNRVIDITENNFETFKSDNPGKPKLLLFSNKKGTPIVFRALSTYFDKTLEFGIVKEGENTESLRKKFKVDSFPTFFLLKNGEQPLKYTDSVYTYNDLFEFVNVHSETFVFAGANDQEVKSSASKPWLNQPIPFMSKDSANDICLKKDGTLCVIYVVPEAAKSDQAVLDALAQVKENFTSKIERGITFSFIRLDASAEPDFAGMFKLGDELPKVIVMNPGKRKRFLISNGDLTTAGISETLDVILGGDARFKVIKGNKLPDLVNTHDQYLHAEPNQKE